MSAPPPTAAAAPSNLPPEPPATPLGQRNGTRLFAVVTAEPWTLAAEVLVVPSGPSGEPGPLIELMQSMAVPDLRSLLASGLGDTPLRPDRPRLIELPPAADAAPAAVIVATATVLAASDKIAPRATVDDVGVAAAAAVELAAAHRCRRLVLPLLDAPDSDVSRDVVAAVVFRAVRQVLRRLDPNPLERIDIVDGDPTALQGLPELARELRAERPANDLPSGRDLLDVGIAARSVADLLLMRDLEPPVAVGVLGGWGSGKSFAMHLMQERMHEIRALPVSAEQAWPGANADTAPSEFVGHVYQVHFNAWTYAHSDLWSGLMQAIFEELDRQFSLESALMAKGVSALAGGEIWRALAPMREEDRRAILDNDEALRAAADEPELRHADQLWAVLEEVRHHQRADLLRMELERDELRQALEERRLAAERAVDEELDQRARAELWSSMASRLGAFLGVDEQVVAAWIDQRWPTLRSSEHDGVDRDAERARLLRQFRLPARALLAAVARGNIATIVILATGFAAAVVALSSLTGAGRLATTAIGLVAATQSAVALVRRGLAFSAAVRGKVDELTAEMEAARERALASKPARIEARLRAAPEQLPQLEELARREEAIERQRRLVGITADFTSVTDLVSTRLAQGDYRERLGLMRQVHLDLRDLSDGITVTDRDDERKRALFPRGPTRVVLFIDDLDRCPPARVVEVFEAVQLLLATPLFVVVIALDISYVARALEKVYAGVLHRWGEPSGLDYIEKIIQIPYRMRRRGADEIDRFLRAHLPVAATVDTSPGAPGAVVPHPTPVATTEAAGAVASGVDVRLAMEFTEGEIAVVGACAALVGLTPRSVKRLINVSKIIRLVWARSDRPYFHLDTSAAVTVLLALCGAHAEVMRGVLAYLETRAAEGWSESLIDALADYPLPPEDRALATAHARYLADVEQLQRLQPIPDSEWYPGTQPVAELADVLSLVATFCLVGDLGSDPHETPPPGASPDGR